MQIPPVKERTYLKQIDKLKIEISELKAENYALGEKFIQKELQDRHFKMKIEETEIEKEEKEIQLLKVT